MKILPSLISVQILKNLLRQSPKTISIVEADMGKQAEKEFQHGRLPQARYFDQLECTTPTKLIPRGLPEIKCFEQYLSRLSVSNEDHIILYDRSPMGFYSSTRAWWLFKTFGVKNLSVLDGGLNKWLQEGNQLETTTNNDQARKFQVRFDASMIKSYEQIAEIVTSKDKNVQIVDARPPNSFNAPTAGHIRGTLNVPYSSLFDGSKQTLKSIDELREIFEKNGVDLKKPTIYTCQTGTTASALAFVGHLLGQSSTPVYNGSFTEWQQRAPKELIGPAA